MGIGECDFEFVFGIDFFMEKNPFPENFALWLIMINVWVGFLRCGDFRWFSF